MAHPAGYNAQSYAWENVGVVSLARVKGASISQHHLVKRTPAGKDAPTLKTEELGVEALSQNLIKTLWCQLYQLYLQKHRKCILYFGMS